MAFVDIPWRAGGSVVSQPPWQDTVGLKTIDDKGKPPSSRIDNPNHAQQIVAMAIEANRERARKEAMIKGMFDGNAPYNSSRLRSSGRGWEANFNTLEGKARKASAKTPYYDLFSAAKTYIDFQTRFGSAADRAEWSGIISEEADQTLKDWIGFNFNMDAMLDDFIGFGQGFLVAPNPWSWRYRKVSKTRVMVLDGTECDIDEGLEVFIIRQKLFSYQLFNMAKNGGDGWDWKACVDAIRNAQPDTETDPWDDPVAIQQRLKDMDLYVTSRAATVNTARLWVKEFDGRISEMMVLEYGYSGNVEVAPQFLYKKVGRYARWPEVFCPFFFDVEEGSWHGATGLGKDIFPIMQTLDRVTCQKINATFMRLALILQAKTPSAMTKAALQTIGNAIMVPPDVAIQNSQVLGDIATAIEVGQDLAAMVDSNTGVYRPRIEKPSGNPEPAASTQLRFGQSNVLSASAVSRFLLQLDRYAGEVTRRLFAKNQHGNDEASKTARECQQRIMDRGVPREALDQVRYVRWARPIGNGSIVMRQQALNAIAPFLGLLGERGRQAFVNRVISAYADQSMVEELNPIEDQKQLPTDHQNIAMLEDAAMRTGGEVRWTPTQNNLIHAQTHIQAMAEAAGSLQKGADKTAVYNFLHTAGPHAHIHLQALAQDPTRKGAVTALTKQWKATAAIADKLGQMLRDEAQKRGQAQRISQGMDPDTQLKAAESQAKMRLKQAETAGKLQLTAEKSRFQMGLKKEQHDAKMGMSRTQVMQDMALKDASTAGDMRRKRLAAFQSSA